MNQKNLFLTYVSIVSFFLWGPVHSAVSDGPGGSIDVVVDVGANSNTPEAAFGAAFQYILCPGGQFAQLCGDIFSVDPTQTADVYRQLSARSVTAMTSLLSQGSLVMAMEDFSARLAALRRAARKHSTASLDQRGPQRRALFALLDKGRGGAAGDDAPRPSVFVSDALIRSNQDETATLAGFDSDLYGVTIGMDYRLDAQTIAGFATRLLGGETQLDYNDGGLVSRDVNLTYYGSYFPGQDFYLEGSIQAGRGMYELVRRINFNLPNVSAHESARGNTRGSQIGFALGAGYEHYLSAIETTALVTAKYRYNNASLDSYTETGSSYSLNVSSQDIRSQTLSLGGQLSSAFSYAGGVILPQLNLVWKHEFDTTGQDIGAGFVADPNGTTFVFRSDERDSDYLELSLGVSHLQVSGMTAFLQYTRLQGYSNYTQSMWSLGLRAEF
ncbi:MAG: autotransporter outer membrane beta-barrel domain-containing protein [Gammaproteobacteria bacterium]|nr:autotransporter outer membrane beta-barrel domain-containing protein [Gammaproteobacteria bacterium]MDH5802553.1 autotransporter outer membrane beta-barrel domain-containing protein [Gammaproteobacteria bacterium]